MKGGSKPEQMTEAYKKGAEALHRHQSREIVSIPTAGVRNGYQIPDMDKVATMLKEKKTAYEFKIKFSDEHWDWFRTNDKEAITDRDVMFDWYRSVLPGGIDIMKTYRGGYNLRSSAQINILGLNAGNMTREMRSQGEGRQKKIDGWPTIIAFLVTHSSAHVCCIQESWELHKYAKFIEDDYNIISLFSTSVALCVTVKGRRCHGAKIEMLCDCLLYTSDAADE